MKIKEFIIYREGDVLFTAENEDDILDGIFLHSACISITPSKYKKLRTVFLSATAALKGQGLKIYATPVDERDEKWIKSFGFVETGLLLDGFKLLKY